MSGKSDRELETPELEQKRTPRLRFLEFQDAEAWEEQALNSLGTFNRGLTYAASDVSKSGVLVLRSSNIQEGSLILDDDLVFVNKEIPDNLYLKSGDIVICMSNGSKSLVGKSAEFKGIYKGKLTAGAFCSIFRPVNSFAKFIFQTNHYLSFVSLSLGGGNINNLKNSALETFSLPIPTDPREQQKIAECLSSLETLITVESQKLEALKTHKKGLMQQLFPGDGETVPKLRFLEFQDAGGWEEMQAGTLFKNRIEAGEDGLPIYSVTLNDGMVKRSSLERKVDDISEPKGNKKVYKNDIAYNMMRMWQGAFGVAPENCMVSPAYVVLLPQENVSSNFFGYLLKLPKYLRLLTSHSQGLTLDRLRLYYKDFAQIHLLHPSLSEQQKIADCLSSLEQLIAVQIQKLETLKTHKKGLMQQLFPAPLEGQG